MRSRYLPTAALLVGLATPLAAQMMPGQMMPGQTTRQPGMQARPIEVQGVLAGAGRGSIFVLDDRNQRWQVSVPAVATVHVTGTLSPDALRSGMVVEFEADIDNRGAAKAKVEELSVGAVSKDRQAGIFPAGSKDAGGEVAGAAGADPAAKAATPAAKRAKRAATAKTLVAGKYRIVGGLIANRNGKFSVHAGRNTIQFELADEPQIKIDTTDLSLVRKGDRVSIKGMVSANRPGMVLAREVKIEVGEPATAKKKPAKPDAKSSDGKPTDGKPADDAPKAADK